MKYTKKRIFLIILLFFLANVGFGEEGSPRIIGPLSCKQIIDSPCFVDVYGNGAKKVAYLSVRINLTLEDSRSPSTYFLNLVEADGSNIEGWPYVFLPYDRPIGGMAVYDIDGDGTEEIIIKGMEERGDNSFVPYCSIFKHAGEGPALIKRIYIDTESRAFPHHSDSKIAVGNVSGDEEAEIIAFNKVIKPSGERKPLVEIIGIDSSFLPVGTPMIVENPDGPLVITHLVEIPDDSSKPYSQYVCGVRVNPDWHGPNEIVWRVPIVWEGEAGLNGYLSSWGELGAGDLDRDGKPEVIATARLTDESFNYVVISARGNALCSLRLGKAELGLPATGSNHPRFVVFGRATGETRVIFFAGHRSPEGDYYLPESQPACAFIDEDDKVDFVIRGLHAYDNGEMIAGRDCFYVVNLVEAYTGSPYDPIVCPLDENTIKEIIPIISPVPNSNAIDPDAGLRVLVPHITHLALADTANDRHFTLAAAKKSGDELDIVTFDSLASSSTDWPQAYGNSSRTNYFAFPQDRPDEISIQLTGGAWELVNVKLGTKNEKLLQIENTGTVPVGINISYLSYSGCKPDSEPGINTFATKFPVRGMPAEERPVPPAPGGVATIADKIKPDEEANIPLIYYAPEELKRGVDRMSAKYELRAFKARE